MNHLIPAVMKNRVPDCPSGCRPLLGTLLVCWAFVHGPAGYGQQNIVYPAGAGAIVDVTKPPYNADNTGRTDCTDALNRAYDDVLRPVLAGQLATERVLAAHPDTLIGQESGAARGVLFPAKTPPSRILYFPNGIYAVSNTICYSFDNLKNARGMELNRQIHFQGQSEKGVILRLRAAATGFGPGTDKPVVSFMRGEKSNVAMSNTFENFTIEVGAGNPGAVGLLYFANNSGAVRQVTIRSRDPQRAGSMGLAITKKLPSGCYVKNLTVDGFDYGVKVVDYMLYTVFEHITLRGQRMAGFQVIDNPVSIRDLRSVNRVPALQLTGERASVVLTDGDLRGGQSSHPAIDGRAGHLFARRVRTAGYGRAVQRLGEGSVAGPFITEYVSGGVQTLFAGQAARSLGLAVEETPVVAWETKATGWVSVNAFGAKGDGKTNDAPAIQRALNSGKRVVYFNPGQYLMDGTVQIPAMINRLHFMFADLKMGPHLKKQAGQGVFNVVGQSARPLVIESLFAWEKFVGEPYLLDHASTRTLILKDLQTQTAALYKNSVPGGRVFLENVACTKNYGNRNCFSFTGQRVWARQLNPERADPEVLNDGSTLWVLGFKTEANGTSFATRNGGKTEVLGGVVNNYNPTIPADKPIVLNDNSSVSFVGVTNGLSKAGNYFRTMALEKRKGTVRTLDWGNVPRRYENQSVIPLYAGYP